MTTVAVSTGDPNKGSGEPRGSALMRQHGAVLARVCMALLGDAVATERALERVARDASTTTFDEGADPVARLMGLARAACANQLSKLPVRNTSAWGADAPEPEEAKPETVRMGRPDAAASAAARKARAGVGKLKPTEREAVVLHLVGRLDAAQVAEACGIDLETARARIARGVAQLVEQEKHR